MSFTTPSDYKGINNITQNKYDVSYLQEYIDELEEEYLTDLLGCELYDLFIADLDLSGLPQSARFIAIYEKICEDIDSLLFLNPYNPFYYDYYDSYCYHRQNRSRGMVEMLKSFVYAEYVREQANTNSSIGLNKSKGVASDPVRLDGSAIRRNFNKGINDFWNIQYYICENSVTYPEFNGIRREKLSIL